jgi:hypothetical protein
MNDLAKCVAPTTKLSLYADYVAALEQDIDETSIPPFYKILINEKITFFIKK